MMDKNNYKFIYMYIFFILNLIFIFRTYINNLIKISLYNSTPTDYLTLLLINNMIWYVATILKRAVKRFNWFFKNCLKHLTVMNI